MGILRAFKKWRTKRRIHKLLLRVIRQFYLNSIKAGGVDSERISKQMGFPRIANNGYDNGGFIYCHPFVFIFGSATIAIAIVDDPSTIKRLDAQRIAEHWTFGYRVKVRQKLKDNLTFIDGEDGPWLEDLADLADELENRWKVLQAKEKYEAQQLYHKLNARAAK